MIAKSCALKGFLFKYGEDDHDECLARGASLSFNVARVISGPRRA